MRALILIPACAIAFAAEATEQWGFYEAAFTGPASSNPYLEISLSANQVITIWSIACKRARSPSSLLAIVPTRWTRLIRGP